MASNASTRAHSRLIAFVVALFFVWGFETVLNDTLIPKLRALFALNYAEAMLSQFCFLIGYLIFSVPARAPLRRLGCLRSIIVGLIVMACECLLSTPAAWIGAYPMFPLALFIAVALILVALAGVFWFKRDVKAAASASASSGAARESAIGVGGGVVSRTRLRPKSAHAAR